MRGTGNDVLETIAARDSHIQQIGTPLEVYHRPVNVFVAGFIGSPAMNLVRGRVVREAGAAAIRLGGGVELPLPAAPALAEGRELVLGLRPDDVAVAGAETDGGWSVEATVSVVEPLGAQSLVFLDLAGTELVGTADGRAIPRVGERVRVRAALAHLHVFDAATERRID